MISFLSFLENLLLRIFSFFLNKRFTFERRNWSDAYSESFNLESSKADLAVEFSSEGEFEQIRYVLEKVLEKEETKIELIYCSESVESNVKRFIQKYPKRVRALRLPLVTGMNKISDWVTSDSFIMVRYDFFFNLLKLGVSKKNFILTSCSTKKIRKKSNFIKSLFFKFFYKKFHKIFCVEDDDFEYLISKLGIDEKKVYVSDFRINRIQERLEKSEVTINEKFKYASEFKGFLNQKEKKIILGSYRVEEFNELKGFFKELIKENYSIFIAPHHLNNEYFTLIDESFLSLGLKYVEINDGFEKFSDKSQLYLISSKGILCEMYSYFDFSYVGGGFVDSVHSLLEPALAGNFVCCGPKVHRSSEFSLIKKNKKNIISLLPNHNILSEYLDFLAQKDVNRFGINFQNDKALGTILEIL